MKDPRAESHAPRRPAPAPGPRHVLGTAVGWLLNLGASALLVWARLLPAGRVAVAALAIALPLLAFIACVRWGRVFHLMPAESRDDVRFGLYPALVLPTIALAITVARSFDLADWGAPLLPALVCGALLAALVLRVERGGPGAFAAFCFALAALGVASVYAGGALVVADQWLDTAASVPVRVSVTGTRVSGGRFFAGERVLLGPAPTRQDWTSLVAPPREAAYLRVGDVACLSEHAGRFGFAWAEVHRCADTPDRAPDAAARHWLAHIARPATQRPPLAQALVDGDWRRVDTTLNALQQRFEAGQATASEVEQGFIPLYNVEPALDAPLANWVAQAPKSYAAHLALALHTERQIEWLAGAGFDERTSPGFNAVERARFEAGEIRASMALSSRPALSLMASYRLTPGAWKEAQAWVDQVVAIDPQDVAMRREYLIQHPICPCRGAAPPDPAMDHLLAAQPPQRVRDALAAHRLLERGLDAGPTPKAIALYTQGLALNPYPQDAYEMHIDIAVALIEQKRLDDAIAELQAAIGVLPGNRHAHEELGYVYELQHRMPQALAEFLVDAERGQSWAQMRSASFMLTPEPGVPLDRRTGARWMREAANSGEPLARDILRRHPDLMIAFPQEY